MNNVSMIPIGRPETLPMDAWQRTIDVNLLSVVRSLHVFLPLLLEQGSGHIVNTASTAGLFAYTFERLPYSATKGRGHRHVGRARALPAPEGHRRELPVPGTGGHEHRRADHLPRPDADQQPARPRSPRCCRGGRLGGRCRAGQHLPRAHPPRGPRDPRAGAPRTRRRSSPRRSPRSPTVPTREGRHPPPAVRTGGERRRDPSCRRPRGGARVLRRVGERPRRHTREPGLPVAVPVRPADDARVGGRGHRRASGSGRACSCSRSTRRCTSPTRWPASTV